MATIRPRNARVPFEIHHDELDNDQDIDEEQTMDESRGEEDESEEVDGGDYSEDSDDSDGTVEPAVREDMDKFEETFKGIKERFRLINRIGEGV